MRYVEVVDRNVELAYVVLETPEPVGLHGFFGDVVGLSPGEPTAAGNPTWRNDSKSQRVIVETGLANDAVAVGLDVGSAHQLEALRTKLSSAGFESSTASVTECAERRVDQLVRVASPFGVDIELVTEHHDASRPASFDSMPGGFHTAGVGFGHAVFATTAFDETHQFLTAGLGFEQSDWLEMEIAEGIELEVRFYHCNPRHHTLAIAKAPFELPQTLHHLMFETNNRDDVGAAFDRVWGTDLTITNGLGQHDNDRMFSFYVASPAGFQVEVGHGAREITTPWADNRRYDQISAWGHQPIPRG